MPGSALAGSVVSAAAELGRKARTLPLGAVLGLGFGLAVGGAVYLTVPSLRPHVWLGTVLVPGCVLVGVGVERILYMMFGYRVGPHRRFREAKETADRRLERLYQHQSAGVYSKERAHHLAERIATEELFGAPKSRGPRGPYRKRQTQESPPTASQPGKGPEQPAA